MAVAAPTRITIFPAESVTRIRRPGLPKPFAIVAIRLQIARELGSATPRATEILAPPSRTSKSYWSIVDPPLSQGQSNVSLWREVGRDHYKCVMGRRRGWPHEGG